MPSNHASVIGPKFHSLPCGLWLLHTHSVPHAPGPSPRLHRDVVCSFLVRLLWWSSLLVFLSVYCRRLTADQARSSASFGCTSSGRSRSSASVTHSAIDSTTRHSATKCSYLARRQHHPFRMKVVLQHSIQGFDEGTVGCNWVLATPRHPPSGRTEGASGRPHDHAFQLPHLTRPAPKTRLFEVRRALLGSPSTTLRGNGCWT